MIRKFLVLSVVLAIAINSLEAKHTSKSAKHSSPHHSTRQNGHQRKSRQVASDAPLVVVDPAPATVISPVDENSSSSSEETNSTNHHSHGNRTRPHQHGNNTHHEHKHKEHDKNFGRNKGQQHKQDALNTQHGKSNLRGEKNRQGSNKGHGKSNSEENLSGSTPDGVNNVVAGRSHGGEGQQSPSTGERERRREGSNKGNKESRREGSKNGGRGGEREDGRVEGRDGGENSGRHYHHSNDFNATNDTSLLDSQVVVREHLHPVQ